MVPKLPKAIAEALQRGATVLTDNQRAARALRRAFDQAMRSEGRDLWAPASVIALDTWMSNLWHTLLCHGAESRMLLNRTQEHSIWHAILLGDQEIPGLRSIDSLCDSTARAWRLLNLYNGRPRLGELGVTTDTRAFQRWAQEFERRCARNLYLTSGQLPEALEGALGRGDLDLPYTGLALIDFDLLPPSCQQLFDSIELAGYAVEHLQTSIQSQHPQLLPAQDARREMQEAAAWARKELEQYPHSHIAIVVPQLKEQKAELDRIFGEILAPALQSINARSDVVRYEFSLGRSLAETSAGATALDLLRWSIDPLPLTSVSALLVSPFFGGEEDSLSTHQDHFAVADFDALEVRRTHLLRPELSLAAMVDLAHASRRKAHLGGLPARLRAMHRVALAEQLPSPAHSSLPVLRTHADWTGAFRKFLKAAGWSSRAESNSITFQAQERWESALDEVASLDFDGTRVSASAVLGVLIRVAQETIFAPESRDAPVQIIGPLEVGGISFDALWFLGADDLSWPPPISRNPLLPWPIQRSLRLPGADPVHDTATARELTGRISRSAAKVVFSFARHTEEGERKLSPILSMLTLTDFVSEELPARMLPLIPETVLDSAPLPPLPDHVIRGGAQILELQAACGFRAFAERRLWSNEPAAKEPGLDARDRGSLVHTVMEALWKKVGAQSALRLMPVSERESLLDQCIDIALPQTAIPSQTLWDAAYLQVQRDRLRTLLNPWLQLELNRPPFTVRDEEKAIKGVRIGPLQLDIRVDRIDETAAGPLIIDYKTGSAAPGDWLSARPDAPQLPLYAILSNSADLAGVAFALLRAGDDLALKGYAVDEAVFGKSSKIPAGSLSDQVAEWRETLTALATAFAVGDARVTPKCYPKTCLRCTQRILCRLDVTTLDDSGDDQEERVDDLQEFAEQDFAHG